MHQKFSSPHHDFLTGEGKMGAKIRAFDWSRTSLGPIEGWPQSLRTAVSMIINSKIPSYLVWGPDLVGIYNDSYELILGSKKVLGVPFKKAWAEVWDDVAPIVARALAGEASYFEDLPLTIERHGYAEQAYFTFCYSPIRDESGHVAGMLDTVIETTDKVHAQRRAEQEQERLTRMFEQAPSFVAMVDGPDHRFRLANAAYLRLIGRSGVVDKTVAEALPDAVEQGYLDLLNDVYSSGKAYRSDGSRYLVQAVPGSPAVERFVDFVYQPLTDSSGAVTGIFIEGNDVTERVRSEMHRRALVELGDWIRDLEDPDELCFQAARILGETLSVSRAGYGSVDMVSETITISRDWNAPGVHTIAGVLHFRDYGSYIDNLKRGETAVIADADKDPRTEATAGMLKAISAQAFVNMPVTEQGGFVALLFLNHAEAREWRPDELALVREVADRTRTAVARIQAERDLQSLTASLERQVEARTAERDRVWVNSRDLLVVVGADGVFRAVNPALTEILGYTQDEVVGHSFHDFVWPDDAQLTQTGLDQAARAQDLTNFENRYRHKDGTARWISWHTSVEGDLVYAYGRDVTAEKEAAAELAQAQDALRQAQKMEAVGQLTGGIAHDFNNLLTGILGAIEMLQTRVRQGRINELERYTAAASSAASRAAALTHRLLAFSRRQPLDPKPVNTNQLVVSMEELLRRTSGEMIQIETVTAAGLWTTLCDPNQLESAILNLAINSRDAMPRGGKLTIETCNVHIDARYASRLGDIDPGQYVCICVSDTGMGMTKDTIEKAFDPFFTTKPIGQGTGLGLSMVYGFAKQSDGFVRIYSELGKGTTIKIFLPRHYGVPVEQEAVPGDAIRRGEGEVVLVVEDEPTVRDLVSEILEDLGYQVIEAHDGPSGLMILRSNVKVDLLVSDVGLPGLNGRQLADAARQHRPRLKVMFMTGYAENAVISGGFLEPGMEMITKPFAVETFAARIREMIEKG